MVFHLDKCIGCHTCSVACKNIWTDRKGAEYMWWNNVETKPGTGYPGRWEDQETYKGGWEKDGNGIRLKEARTALQKLMENPEQTERVFEITQAMGGKQPLRLLRRPDGGRSWAWSG